MYSFRNNRVVRDTGATYPIFQAPIGLISRSDLVGGVSASGAVGIMETMFLPIPEMQAEFDKIKARSNHPFGLHLLVAFLQMQPEREKAVLDWALDGKSNFITTGYGDPTRYIKQIKDAGLTTYHMTDTLDEALRAEDAGVDGIVLGGAEKGGGNGADNLHTFALLQKARRRLGIPIIATGGIADGIGMAAAFALGAEGVMMGTRFIASKECPWHENYKQALVEAEQVIAISSTSVPGSTAMRAVRTPYAEAVARGEAGEGQGPYRGDAGAMFYGGRTDVALIGCGESAVLIEEVKSAGDIISDTVRQFWEEIERLEQLRAPLSS